MRAIKRLIIGLFLLFGCKDESHNFQYSARLLYPNNYISVFSEPYLENNQLSFAYRSEDTGQLNHVFNFDIHHNLTERKTPINTPGSFTLQSLLKTSSGNYLGACIDKSNMHFEYVVVQFDKNLNPIRDLIIRDSVKSLGLFKLLKNGDYIIQYRSLNFNGFGLVCFDKDLGLKWQKRFQSGVAESYTPSQISISDKFIHVLSKFNDGNYFVSTIDFQGELMGTSLPSSGNISAEKICGTPDGFSVFGHFIRADKRQSMFIHKYDLSSNLIESKVLETNGFSYGDVYFFYFVSDILHTNNAFYFTVNVNNLTTLNEKVTQVKLVKLQSDLNIEWVKMLDSKRKVDSKGFLAGSDYLLLDGESFVNIGKSIWNNVEGLSIIKVDIEGNIKD
jgi:hypothetical protein